MSNTSFRPDCHDFAMGLTARLGECRLTSSPHPLHVSPQQLGAARFDFLSTAGSLMRYQTPVSNAS